MVDEPVRCGCGCMDCRYPNVQHQLKRIAQALLEETVQPASCSNASPRPPATIVCHAFQEADDGSDECRQCGRTEDEHVAAFEIRQRLDELEQIARPTLAQWMPDEVRRKSNCP